MAVPRGEFTGLLRELRAAGPVDRVRLLARSLAALRGLSPWDRKVLLRMAGFEGAEALVERLATADEGTARRLRRLLGRIEAQPDELERTVRALADPSRRGEALDELLAALDEGAGAEGPGETPAGRPELRPELPPARPPAERPPVEPAAKVPRPTAAAPRSKAPAGPPPAVPRAAAPAAKRPPTRAPAASGRAAVKEPPRAPGPGSGPSPAPPAEPPRRPEPAPRRATPPAAEPPRVPAPPPAPSPAAPPAPSPAGAEPAAAGTPPTAAAAMGRLGELRRRIAAGRAPSARELARLLETGIPFPWARRRALLAWLAAAGPAELAASLDLVAELAAPYDRTWCLAVLAAGGPWSEAEWTRILEAAPTPAARRRLEHRRTRP